MVKSLYIFLILVILSTLTYINSLTVDGGAKTIYGRSPKLKLSIKGLDTSVDSAAINLTLYYLDDAGVKQFVRALRTYTITKDVEKGQGIILNLLDGQTWAKMEENKAPVSLWLSKVTYGVDVNNPGPNQLQSDPIIVARILKTPVITPSVTPKVIYQTTTPQITINGTGLVGAKSLKLYFTPSLFLDIDYGIAESQFPLKKDSFKVSLRQNGKWCPNPKDGNYPVKLILNGVDTGAGPIKVGGDTGVVIANVMPDKAGHKVTVSDTSEQQVLYNDAGSLLISGTSFNPAGTRLVFANGMSLNKNYTISAITDTTMVLNLVQGMRWRANPMTLPAKLTVLQVDAGDGFVAVGPINSAKGRDVAKVYQRPNIFPNRDAQGVVLAPPTLNQQQSHELWIYGTGFIPLSKIEYGTNALQFSPPIDPNAYTITCTARNKLVVSLKDGQKWGPVGDLKVVAVKTIPATTNPSIMKNFYWTSVNGGEGQVVAKIVEDVGADKQGGITVIPSSIKIYASVRNDVIHVMGSGFAGGMSVTFFSSDFEDANAQTIVQGTDFDLAVLSSNELTLTLKEGKGWMEKGKSGGLFMKTVSPPGSAAPFELAGGEGIRVAVVYADPVVEKAMDYDTIHETQSKVLTLWGRGFTTRSITKVELRPTPTGNYKVLSVDEDYIKIQLLDKKDWLPPYMHMDDSKLDKISLKLTKIDTGAGLISLPDDGTVVGYIVKDRAGVTCDDSCEYAFDGVCDDVDAISNWKGDYGYSGYDYSYYYGYNDIDDFNGQNVDDDYLSTAYSYQHEHDDYDFWTDDGNLGACLAGTDCTDCGGVDAEIDWNTVELGADDDYADEPCTNTCPYARDGVCDDPRGEDYCALGTDCQDCGVVGHSNFTAINDDVWWDDDDYWAFDDADFLDQTKGIDANRHRIASSNDEEDEVSMFLLVLEGIVYAIGGAFVVLGGYIAYKMSTGNASTVYQALALELTEEELEMVPTQRMAITPDVVRTQ